MVIVEVRRHAERAGSGDRIGALSRQGVETARALVRQNGYALVLSSPRDRARETALAIAERVDEITATLDVASDEILTQEQYDAFKTWYALTDWLSMSGPARRWAEEQLDLWAAVAHRLPDSERALLVTHGSNVELPAALLATQLRADLGPLPFQALDGVRVIYQHGRIVGARRLNADAREVTW